MCSLSVFPWAPHRERMGSLAQQDVTANQEKRFVNLISVELVLLFRYRDTGKNVNKPEQTW